MDITKELREKAAELLNEGKVKVVVGYGEGNSPERPRAVFITKPEDVGRLVWNKYCYYNLTTYITKQEICKLGSMAVVVKGCDARTIVVLEKESQIKRADITVIGVTCDGVGDPLQKKCLYCDVHTPREYDILVGNEIENKEVSFEEKYADVVELAKMSNDERWAFWNKEFSKCIKCYACSNICPLCYCSRCIVEKNQPQWVDSSSHPKGTYAWNMIRAFHLAGRCIGCGECQRACPMGIPLNLINKKLAMEVEQNFKFKAGYDINDDLAMATYKEEDEDGFIK